MAYFGVNGIFDWKYSIDKWFSWKCGLWYGVLCTQYRLTDGHKSKTPTKKNNKLKLKWISIHIYSADIHRRGEQMKKGEEIHLCISKHLCRLANRIGIDIDWIELQWMNEWMSEWMMVTSISYRNVYVINEQFDLIHSLKVFSFVSTFTSTVSKANERFSNVSKTVTCHHSISPSIELKYQMAMKTSLPPFNLTINKHSFIDTTLCNFYHIYSRYRMTL